MNLRNQSCQLILGHYNQSCQLILGHYKLSYKKRKIVL